MTPGVRWVLRRSWAPTSSLALLVWNVLSTCRPHCSDFQHAFEFLQHFLSVSFISDLLSYAFCYLFLTIHMAPLMSIMCVILCHRDTPRQCFKSRILLETEWHRKALWGHTSLSPLDIWKRIPYACPPSQGGQDIAFPQSSYPTFDYVTMTPYAAKTTHPPSLEKGLFIRLIKSEY